MTKKNDRQADADVMYSDTRAQLPSTNEDAYDLNMRLAIVRDRQLERLQNRARFYAVLACTVFTGALALAARFS